MLTLDEAINPAQIIKSIKNNDLEKFKKPLKLILRTVRINEEVKFAFKILNISQILVYRHMPLYNLNNLKIIILVITIIERTQNERILVKSKKTSKSNLISRLK